MHHNCRLLRASAVYLLLHIRPVLDILAEMANVASDFLVWLERERDDGDETECEPLPALGYLLSVLVIFGLWKREIGGRRTRPEKLPQFWHCTVMCSAPERAELKTVQC
jgi:hypothetical protein